MTLKETMGQYLWDLDGRKLRVGAGFAPIAQGQDYHETLDHDLACLMRVYEEGIRYFDTSRSYGNSEQAMGEFVSRIPRESIFLATKSKFPFKDKTVDAVALFKDNFYQSFERLKTDHINFFLIHDTEHFEVCLAEIIPFLMEKKAEGLIDFIGLGTRSLNAHELAVRSGYVDGILSYLNYSLLKRSASSLIELCKQHDVAFINASVIHFGLIKDPDPLHPKEPVYGYDARIRQKIYEMQNLCRSMKVDILQASLQCSLFHPDIDLTLNGIARLSNIDSTIAAMRATILPEQWAAIAQLMQQDPYLYIQDDLPTWG